MEYLIVVLAMALDTLSFAGRVALLAFLLTITLYGFSRVLPQTADFSVHLLYRKGALLALILVPSVVYLFDFQLPVPVETAQRFATPIPGNVMLVVLLVWLVGAGYCLIRFSRQLLQAFVSRSKPEVVVDVDITDKTLDRLAHWQNRLNITRAYSVQFEGSTLPWHLPGVIILPMAARNWPIGVVDAMLLIQLAQIKQHSWRWVVFGHFVAALFWPTPWVRRLVDQLVQTLGVPAQELARSAYRDPDGWRRDQRNLRQRLSELKPIGAQADKPLLRIPSMHLIEIEYISSSDSGSPVSFSSGTFDDKWQQTKRGWQEKHYDPYERAYWLIAMATILVATATTFTIVQAPPEFEPEFLEIKWQERMLRHIDESDE